MAKNKTFNFMEDIDFGEVTVKEKAEEEIVKPDSDITERRERSEPDTATEEDVKIGDKFVFSKKNKETKTVHKNFLISKSMSEKFSALAKKTGRSENELFNEILRQIFEE